MKLTIFGAFVTLTTAIFAAPHPFAERSKSHALHTRANLTARDDQSQTLWSGVVIPKPLDDGKGNIDPYSDVSACTCASIYLLP